MVTFIVGQQESITLDKTHLLSSVYGHNTNCFKFVQDFSELSQKMNNKNLSAIKET